MKTKLPTVGLVVLLAGSLMSNLPLPAAVTVVDTFDQGGYSVSLPEINATDETVSLPFANRRAAVFNWGLSLSIREMSRTLDSTAGTLSSVVDGLAPLPEYPLGLDLIYSGPGRYSITDYTGFLLGFSALAGVGTLYIELGSAPGFEGIHRVDLTGPGEVFFPVSRVRPTASNSLDSFTSMHFHFEARSEQFSFTLDEIRLIPEPSASLLALVAGAGLLGRRRRG